MGLAIELFYSLSALWFHALTVGGAFESGDCHEFKMCRRTNIFRHLLTKLMMSQQRERFT